MATTMVWILAASERIFLENQRARCWRLATLVSWVVFAEVWVFSLQSLAGWATFGFRMSFAKFWIVVKSLTTRSVTANIIRMVITILRILLLQNITSNRFAAVISGVFLAEFRIFLL